MNRTKSILVAAGISLAMAFMFSCSSDDKDDFKEVIGYCLEYYQYDDDGYNHNFCEKVKTYQGGESQSCSGGTFAYSCPVGYKQPKICERDGFCAQLIGKLMSMKNESDCINSGGTVKDYNTYNCRSKI